MFLLPLLERGRRAACTIPTQTLSLHGRGGLFWSATLLTPFGGKKCQVSGIPFFPSWRGRRGLDQYGTNQRARSLGRLLSEEGSALYGCEKSNCQGQQLDTQGRKGGAAGGEGKGTRPIVQIGDRSLRASVRGTESAGRARPRGLALAPTVSPAYLVGPEGKDSRRR